ncbi:MAG: hypothetical protein EP335_06590 [Alphaproteobacteria bacterium]|nr:MAG: hypothetical protein EP335_06590 [Alphaproteobacteria bacterium]
MSLTLIIAGIKAILRAGQAGANLYAEHARDRAIFLPDLSWPAAGRRETIGAYFQANPTALDGEPLAAHWVLTPTPHIDTDDPTITDLFCALMLKHQAQAKLVDEGKSEEEAKRDAELLAGGRMVEQWRDSRKPPSAWARMALTITDIGLEFVAASPSMFGIGSKGETLVGSFAEQMNTLIPDNVGDMGPRNGFSDRLLGIFLRAGLGTLEANSSLVIRDENVAKLVSGVTKPIVEALPSNLAEQMVYRDLVDALAGPAAEAAFRLLAENTDDYLGKSFADDKALGAVTTALFTQLQSTAAAGNVLDQFGHDGLIRLYQSGLQVAIDTPALFLASDGSAKQQLFQDLLKGTATVLKDNPTFKGAIGTSMAVMAIETVGAHAPTLLKLDPDKPWELVATTALAQVTETLGAGVESGKGAFSAFGEKQLLDLGRVLLEQAAKTPGMLGVDKTELQAIVAGIAKAMAADDHLLLTSDDWIKIAAVAAREAAANPGRLFGTGASSLATTVIGSVLKVAGDAWSDGTGRAGQPRLFGDTLRDAITAVVTSLGGNITKLKANPDLVKQFMENLVARATAEPDKFGAASIGKLVKSLIGGVLASGSLPTDAQIDAALAA